MTPAPPFFGFPRRIGCFTRKIPAKTGGPVKKGLPYASRLKEMHCQKMLFCLLTLPTGKEPAGQLDPSTLPNREARTGHGLLGLCDRIFAEVEDARG